MDGVTTNPTLIAKSGRPIREVLAEICDLVDGPVSGETVSTDAEEIVREGHRLREIADNLNVKVPLTVDGIKATKILSDEGIPVNVTLLAQDKLCSQRRQVPPSLVRLSDGWTILDWRE